MKAWKINARGVGISTVYLLLGLGLKFAVINPTMNQTLADQKLPTIESFITPEA